MVELYGPSWGEDLAMGEVTEDAIEESAEPLTGPLSDSPGTVMAGQVVPLVQQVPDVGNVGGTSSVSQSVTEAPSIGIPVPSPGSGVASGAESPGSGRHSVRSWSSQNPGTPESLGASIF